MLHSWSTEAGQNRPLTRFGALAAPALLVGFLLVYGGCSKPVQSQSTSPPEVAISGGHTVAVGGTRQLSATTLNASDASYAWNSADPSVATVDAGGVVTGVATGEVTITATGSDSQVSGAHIIVVVAVAPPDLPYYDKWSRSAHADRTAEAFNRWNDDDPPLVPSTCARCHTTPGYRDYLGADGTQALVVDNPAPTGSVVECTACHNEQADSLSQVTFPSGVVVDGLGAEARCITCHQGRSSADSVDAAIATAAATDLDAPNGGLNFQNIHYYAAGATRFAGQVRGGYQYEGRVYDWRHRHVPGFDTCTGCHDPHSLEINLSACSSCHLGVLSTDDLKNIRMMSSLGVDYDGDGDRTEGVYFEMVGLRDKLMSAIAAYATEVVGESICYGDAYPYFFVDGDADGACDATETSFGNRFANWTPRLLKAAYNFQVASKDPGAFAHNVKYIMQLLHDSIADLNTQLTSPIPLDPTQRNDPGHFNGASGAARHWDENETVNASCSRCHGGSEGFRFYVEFGASLEVLEQSNGLDCATCHQTFAPDFSLVTVDEITFPGGATYRNPGNASNLCITCHQGRTAKADIDAAIAANNFRFLNVHYLPAGAVKLGRLAAVGYEYPGKTYAAEWTTHPASAGSGNCVGCHDPVSTAHSFLVSDNFSRCASCHSGASSARDIRQLTGHLVDIDGDGNTSEPLADELATLAEDLLAGMQLVTAGATPICYDPDSYPYWFIDSNASGGQCDASEASFGNRFPNGSWTPALMKAAHNYQIYQKDPGAWAHNFDYTAQLLIDSIEDLTGDASGYARP